MEASLTKGIGFRNVQSFTLMRFGDQAYEKVLAQLSEEDRRVLGGIIPVGWYELALYARVIHAVNRLYGRGDLSLLDQLGQIDGINQTHTSIVLSRKIDRRSTVSKSG